MKKISIIIPAFNEESYLPKLLDSIETVNFEKIGFKKEIIIVDDGSSDNTLKLAKKAVSDIPEAKVFHQNNQGKGKAVQKGISEASGEYVIVQDADLEYDPQDYKQMLMQINEHNCVYGSRILGQIHYFNRIFPFPGKHPNQSFGSWCAGVILSFSVFLMYRTWITDTLTAYKLYPMDAITNINVVTDGFETDHEITAKLIKNGMKITEVPIHYSPRTIEQGKKICMKDGFIALWTLLKFRF
jgi:glycosyltransferase involved in cell wall biosynthesis